MSSESITLKSPYKRVEMNDDDTKTEEKIKPVSIRQLFKYATKGEKTLLFAGLITATIAGLGMPATIILFGELTNTFVYHAMGKSATNVFNDTNSSTLNPERMSNISNPEIADATENFSSRINQFGWRLLLVGFLQLCFSYIMVTCLNISAGKQILRIKVLFLRSVLRQDMQWFDTQKTGDFATTSIENLSKLEDGIGEKIGMIVYFLSNFFSSIIVAFCYGWKLTLVIMSVTPVLGVATAIFAKFQTSLTADETKAYSNAGVIVEETLSAIRTVVAFSGENVMLKKYEAKLVDAYKTGIKRALINGLGQASAWFIIYGSYALAFWYGVTLIIASFKDGSFDYDPRKLLIVFFSAIMGAMNVGQSSPYVEALSMARGAATYVYKVIDQKPLIDSSSKGGVTLDKLEGNVQFTNVHFSYPARSDVPVLNGLNLTVKKGETIALVGSSGCGKSTIIQLLQRFYDPSNGEVIVDGHLVKEFNLHWFREQIGVVSQEPILFGMTIEENIRLGKNDISHQDVENAAKAANAYEFIKKLPMKYETMVGDRGAQLSGGQKQRIAIARALVRDPSILLLDEATSALDTQSESLVQAALDEVAGSERTTFIIAHRLTTIRNVDKIIVIDNGRVKELGSHDELMKMNGLYYQLVNAQIQTAPDHNMEEMDITEPVSSYTTKFFSEIRQNSTPEHVSIPRTSVVSKTELKPSIVEKKANFWSVIKLNSKEWPQILLGCIAALGFGCTTPCYALLFGEIMRVLSLTSTPEKASEESIKYSCLFLAIGAWAGITIFVQIYMFSYAGEKLTMRLRTISFKSMLRQEMSWYDLPENNTGALCTRLANDAANVQGATGSRIGVILQTCGSLGIAIILALVIVWKQALVSIALIPLVFAGGIFQAKQMSGQTMKDMKAEEDAGKVAIEAISNIRTVVSLSREEAFCQMYQERIEKLKSNNVKQYHLRGLMFGFSQAVPMACYSLSLWYGGHLIENEGISYDRVFKVGELLIFGAMMVGQSLAFAPNYTKGLVSAGKILELLKIKPSIDSESELGGKMADTEKYSIEFQDVVFCYPSRPQSTIFQGFNMKIEDGETVALVGSSGCGKSTCIQLLERFYDPSKGNVIFGSKNINMLNVTWLRNQFGLVSQEPILFDASIRENIEFGDNSRSVTMDEIIKVASKANIHNFITTLPKGYETNVGSKGTQLSGGQKQRIAIARALIRNPKILLLDEATSALDTESEKVVQEALEVAMKNQTSIVIAHRLTTIQNVDKIFVFHHGKIVEAGTHDELLSKKNFYYKLHNVQSKAYDN